MEQLEKGAIPKQTTKETLKALNELKQDIKNPQKVLAVIKNHIPEKFLESHYAEYQDRFSGKKERSYTIFIFK